MPFKPGEVTNPKGRPKGSKPFKQMLEIALKEDPQALRKIADALVKRAAEGDNVAIKEVADRLDGKPNQAIIGDNDADPINQSITVKFVDKDDD